MSTIVVNFLHSKIITLTPPRPPTTTLTLVITETTITTTTIIYKDSLNSFVALSLFRTSSLDSVDKIINRKVPFKLSTINWKLKQKEKSPNDIHTLPAFARAFFIFCFVFSFELFRKKEVKFVMRCK